MLLKPLTLSLWFFAATASLAIAFTNTGLLSAPAPVPALANQFESGKEIGKIDPERKHARKVDVTFSTPFAETPVLTLGSFASGSQSVAFVPYQNEITKDGFSIWLKSTDDRDAGNSKLVLHWIALGPR